MAADTTLRTVARRHAGTRHGRWLVSAVPVLVVVAGWEVASGLLVPSEVLPPFSATVPEVVALGADPGFRTDLLHTLFRGLAGIAVATGLAVPLGLAMERSERVRRNVDPVVSLTYPVPKSPLIPLVIFWLGIGHTSRVALAVIGSFLPVLLSSYNGADGVRREFRWAARSMGLSRTEETFEVVLPAALPTIATGVRIGLIFSFIIVISSEMILATSGVGVPVVRFGQYGQYERVFAAVVWIAVLVAGLDRLYLAVSRRVLAWSDQEVGGL